MSRYLMLAALIVGIVLAAGQLRGAAKMNANPVSSPPAVPAPGQEVVTLGGGCFWCVEAIFDDLKGVVSVESGYSGGKSVNPTYKEVCSGQSGHAEVTQIIFDPGIITLKEILEIFFTVHDPTTLNRQGADSGTQYRSVIYYRTPEQKATAVAVMAEIGALKLWSDPIVTELAPFDTFYRAENYHQDYFALNGEQPYCQVVIAPKVAKFRQHFADRLKK